MPCHIKLQNLICFWGIKTSCSSAYHMPHYLDSVDVAKHVALQIVRLSKRVHAQDCHTGLWSVS